MRTLRHIPDRAHGPTPGRAFTIVELMVTISIIGVVLFILVPILGAARDAARRTACLSNARQLVAAVNIFGTSNQGRLPENRTLVSETEYITWRRVFAERGLIDAAEVWACPLHPRPGPRGEAGFTENGARCVGDIGSSYALNGHVLWRREKVDDAAVRADTIIRRPSHTILLAETNRAFSELRASPPIVANYYGDSPGPYGYWHEGRGVYGFLDGHVELIAFLDTGSPDCRWHNGPDLTDDPFVPQTQAEYRPHAHPDWRFLVPDIYRGGDDDD